MIRMKGFFARLFGRIACVFGSHTFSPVLMDYLFDHGSKTHCVYRMKGSCIYCGENYDGLVQMPYDEAEKFFSEGNCCDGQRSY